MSAALAIEPTLTDRVWILACPLCGGHGERFDFYRADAADGTPALTPFVSVARPFPTAGAAYAFARHRVELQSWIVIGSPRLILPRYRGPRAFR